MVLPGQRIRGGLTDCVCANSGMPVLPYSACLRHGRAESAGGFREIVQ